MKKMLFVVLCVFYATSTVRPEAPKSGEEWESIESKLKEARTCINAKFEEALIREALAEAWGRHPLHVLALLDATVIVHQGCHLHILPSGAANYLGKLGLLGEVIVQNCYLVPEPVLKLLPTFVKGRLVKANLEKRKFEEIAVGLREYRQRNSDNT